MGHFEIAVDNANAAMTSLKLREGLSLNPSASKKLSNKTHISISDPDASLAYKTSSAQKLKYKNEEYNFLYLHMYRYVHIIKAEMVSFPMI